MPTAGAARAGSPGDHHAQAFLCSPSRRVLLRPWRRRRAGRATGCLSARRRRWQRWGSGPGRSCRGAISGRPAYISGRGRTTNTCPAKTSDLCDGQSASPARVHKPSRAPRAGPRGVPHPHAPSSLPFDA
ncbi:uncharacterized protein SCHCODRAFT_02211287 [Schizophyllum commune H4-8]|uniref:uncharacterized protein n=1 Tax=Schizophyllum commune (strain H4-8 / FGSC 9210) TaxID=578458 RepID=UPI00215E444F|nr:uncharacterized protein SCHCODRAFT_02211287 [Schizophyllum commune H4-8]KAI5894531.1 hypothetical protein SCHCODRAFT_02211287 [Schizophyllum commune H4-8]